jgi:hypothetical protein
MLTLPKTLLLLIISSSLFGANVIEASRVVPPDFDEVDYGLVKARDRLVLNVSSPCGIIEGHVTGGLWTGGPTQFQEIVPLGYRGSHKGMFHGTYQVCSSGGGGNGSAPSEPPKWNGSANAGRYYHGPMVIDLAYIDPFPSFLPYYTDVVNAYKATHGGVIDEFTAIAIADFVAGLALTANVPPDGAYHNDEDFNSRLVASKQYRLYTKLSIKIGVNKDGVIVSHEYFGKDADYGWTPLAGLYEGTPFLRAIPGPGILEQEVVTPSYIMLTKRMEARVGDLFAIPAGLLIDANVPYIWSQITYKINADGTYSALMLSSHFPSHNLYKSDAIVLERPFNFNVKSVLPQEKLGQFMYMDIDDANAPPHSASPVTFSGDADAL